MSHLRYPEMPYQKRLKLAVRGVVQLRYTPMQEASYWRVEVRDIERRLPKPKTEPQVEQPTLFDT